MRVRIRGKVILKKDGKVIAEVPNTILLDNLTSILAQVFQGSPPSGNGEPYVLIISSSGVIPTPVIYKNFTWTGIFIVPVFTIIFAFILNATFNGYQFRASEVTTAIQLPPGSYELEWVWDVDDPVGVVKDILNFGFAGTFSSASATVSGCGNLMAVDVFQNYITLLFACLETVTTTYSDVTVQFTVTNTSNTTYHLTTELPFAFSFKLQAPNTLVVPVTIILV